MALQDVVGQEKAVNILLRTIQRGRIPSSYLFVGESGIGKKFTAVNLAKTLNCQNIEQRAKNKENIHSLTVPHQRGEQVWEIDCCDECSSCKKIDSGVHPDFLLIAPHGGQIRIEEIRAIDGMLSLKPFEGRWKIVIVDEANMMNPYAANAFLRTLEEPPKESLIILISSNHDQLPDTIRSRCSRLNFTPLSDEACRKVIESGMSRQSDPFLPTHSQITGEGQEGGKEEQGESSQKTAFKKLGIGCSRDPTPGTQLSTLVRLCMGRPGLAISGDLIEERKWFLELLQEMMKSGKDGWESKEEMERWFDLIALLLRDVAVIQITRDEKNLINIDLNDYIRKFGSTMDLQGIINKYQKLNTLKGYLNFNLNKSLTWNYTGALLRRLKTYH